MKKLSLIIALFTLSLWVNAAEFMFKHLEVKNGLSNNQINNIFKDSEGFMWFATVSGLNRYDGYQVKTYCSYNMDSGPLPDNYVQSVQQDAAGKLWIQTQTGYTIYDPLTQAFNRDLRSWMLEIGIETAPTLTYIDAKKHMWFYLANKGCYLYMPENQLLYPLLFDAGQLPVGKITDISECKEGILIIYDNGMVLCFDKDSNKMKWQLADIKQQQSEKPGNYSSFVDREGNIWIYSELGLWVYNPANKKWQTQLSDVVKTQARGINTIAQDKEGRIWLGKKQGGIDILDKSTGKVIRLESQPGDERGIQDNTITVLYEDNNGVMWVGTQKRGVSFYNAAAYKFGLKLLGDINCIEEDNGGYVWMGTNGEGLIRWNTNTGEQTKFTHNEGAASLADDDIVCILRAKNGKVWVGTFQNGLDCYDNGRFIHYKNIPENKNSLANNNVSSLSEDKQGNIWVGTLGGGVQCLNPQTGQFTTYNLATADLQSDNVTSVFVTKENNLLLGSDRGLSILNISTKKFNNLIGTKSGKTNLSNQNVTQVYEDSRGLIWIGTREGLNMYNPKKDELTVLTKDQGLSHQLIVGISEDSDKNMWVTTANGVTSIELTLDPQTVSYSCRCTVYNEKDGLQSGEFNRGAIKQLSTGQILMGGLYGVNYFKPADIKSNKILPKAFFTKFMIFDDEVEIGKTYGDRVILKNALNDVDEINLNHKQNIFTIQFSSDSYILSEKVKYAYKMEGLNDDWIITNNNKLTYSGLAPGTYILKVKAINSDGYGSDQEATLKIVVHPPFWFSIWAYILYAILFVGILVWARRFIVNSERTKFNFLQKKEKAEREQEVNDMKLHFFANISQDLRNPLVSIMPPLEELLNKYATDDNLGNPLKVIKRNSVKLLNLVNGLLDFSKTDVSAQQLNLEEADIITYVNNMCTSFTEFSEGKEIRLTFYSPLPSLSMTFDEDKIGKIMMNLISNAFKFTNNGGRIDVMMDVVQEYGLPEMLEIRVADTGIGIRDDEKELVFERFYQVNNPGEVTSGSGIGLSIVRDFVMLHGGTIKVVDNTAVGVGSVFVVRIPIKRSGIQLIEKEEASLDTSFIQTVKDFENLKEGDKEAEVVETNNSHILEEDDIETISSIKVQRARVIQLTEEEDGRFVAQVMLPDVLPDDAFDSKGKHRVEVASVTHDILSNVRVETGGGEDKRPIVLVVDGNEDFRSFMYASLSSTYRVKLASDGPEAWKMIPELMPNIIISDMLVADAEYHQLCTLVKSDARTANIPFILLSARSSDEDKSDYIALGADDYIAKPFNMNILTLRMQKLLNIRNRKGRTSALEEVVITPMDEKFIDHVVKYVESSISRSDLSVEELSKELGMSRVNLYKKLVAITGRTPIEFIRVIRLKRAAQLLRQGQQNVSEIAFMVGFNNPKYFSKYFKDEFGMLPSTYQEREGR